MPPIFVPVGAFSPGGSRFGDGLAEASDVLPLWDGYYPVQAKSVESSPGAATYVTGAYGHIFPSGGGTALYIGDQLTIFAGNKTTLWTADVLGWTDVSRAGGYAVAVGAEPAGWCCASYGNDIWAANGLDIFQRRTNNAGLFANGPTSTFVPRPRFCAVVREFMLGADLSANGGGRSADEFCWSDSNDATWYDDRTGARAASLAGSKKERSRPGQITGLTGGQFGVIYKARSTHALQFTGGSDVFRLDELSPSVGVTLPGSLIHGRFADYFFGGDGFYRRVGLAPPEKISPPSIDQLFVDPRHYVATGYIHDQVFTMWQEDLLMQGFEDSRTGILFWPYAHRVISGITSTQLPLNFCICYNPDSGLWSLLSGLDLKLTIGLGIPERSTIPTSADLSGVRWFDHDAGAPRLCRFGGTNAAARLTSKRQVLSTLAGAAVSAYRIRRVLPQFSVPASASVFVGPPPATPNIQITLRLANDLHFDAQTDAAGTVVSPREDILVQASANDWGWLASVAEGSSLEVQLDIPAGGEWRSFLGLWLDAEPVTNVA